MRSPRVSYTALIGANISAAISWLELDGPPLSLTNCVGEIVASPHGKKWHRAEEPPLQQLRPVTELLTPCLQSSLHACSRPVGRRVTRCGVCASCAQPALHCRVGLGLGRFRDRKDLPHVWPTLTGSMVRYTGIDTEKSHRESAANLRVTLSPVT